MGISVTGTPAVSGTACAPATWITTTPLPTGSFDEIPSDQHEAEYERFIHATTVVAKRLSECAHQTEGHSLDILRMTATLATDPAIAADVRARTDAGANAVPATIEAFHTFIHRFENGSHLMSQRAVDLKDVRDRIVAELTGADAPAITTPDAPVILLGDDLSPANAATLDPERILGIATINGGPTSHTVVIARQLGIPCVVAARELRTIDEGQRIRLNGADGTIEIV